MNFLLIHQSLHNATLVGTTVGVAGVICVVVGIVPAIRIEPGPCATDFWRFLWGYGACRARTFLIPGASTWQRFRSRIGRTVRHSRASTGTVRQRDMQASGSTNACLKPVAEKISR